MASLRRPAPTGGAGDEARIEGMLARYSPTIEAQLREARNRLWAHFPRGFELVFDNYNALVFGISPTEATSGAFISVAGYPKWVTLFFRHGASLRDPGGLLEGVGKQVRSIRLTAASDLDKRAVTALIAQATAPVAAALREAPARDDDHQDDRRRPAPPPPDGTEAAAPEGARTALTQRRRAGWCAVCGKLAR